MIEEVCCFGLASRFSSTQAYRGTGRTMAQKDAKENGNGDEHELPKIKYVPEHLENIPSSSARLFHRAHCARPMPLQGAYLRYRGEEHRD